MRYYLDPHGCAKNQVDAENMMESLTRSGWVASTDPIDAELLIVNSCGFMESAKKESIDAVLRWKAVYPDKRVLLAGCLAQRYPTELGSELTELDGIFGNADLSRIGEAAVAAMGDDRSALVPEIDTTGLADFGHSTATRPLLSLPGSAYVKITEGCDNKCTYCAIPLIRGPMRSRPIDSVVSECRGLISRGIRELCLIGQDLGSYGLDRARLAGQSELPALLTALSALEGDFWIRLLYIHPDRFPHGILEICTRDSRILPYFDLPFQHASRTILRAMNRKGDAETYLALISSIRSALPDATIRSTFLVGFPGETEGDMAQLLDFQQRARIDWLGAFEYSREEGTPAFNLKARVSKKLASARRKRVEEAQLSISEERMERFVGKNLRVLVEEKVEGEEGLYLGRAACQAPEVDGAVVLSSGTELECGSFQRAHVFRRAGLDLDAARLPPSDSDVLPSGA